MFWIAPFARVLENGPCVSEAVPERSRHDVSNGGAARADRDASRLQHTGRDLDVDPDHPAAASPGGLRYDGEPARVELVGALMAMLGTAAKFDLPDKKERSAADDNVLAAFTSSVTESP